MPTQTFKIYTAKGYAGDLVDSGPRVVQTGVLTSASAGFGLAIKRDAATVARGVALGGLANVFAISQREWNHESDTRPSDGTTSYKITESISLIRQGYVYVKLNGLVSIAAGAVLHVDTTSGEFVKTAVGGTVVACTNVVAEEAGVAGDIIKVRIDIE